MKRKRTYEDGASEAMRMAHCRDPRGSCICEHCDGERSSMVRHDELRGWVCQWCDSALDEMYADSQMTDEEQREQRAECLAIEREGMGC